MRSSFSGRARSFLTFAFLILTPPSLVEAADGPLAPAEALKAFQVPGDLRIDLVLSEPEIAQPVFLNFDERGRLWVVEYRQYPNPAGVKVLSRDGVWRVVYDKVSPPPPNHFRGADRITIHEDTNGDGTFDAHKTFLDGLNIVTACERGRGGVWVLNPPYLLFYPDRNNDDIPDGNPEVRLEGFGLEDTHSVVNSLRWGPDGWLYAAQGSTVSGRVKKPGSTDAPVHSMGQLIWRYHPEKRLYEVFAEGGGNAFGVEIDARGRIFSGHNGGNTRGFHYVQGGYLLKGFDKHGPLSNPYTFGYFPAMRHTNVPRFTHNFVIYEAQALPASYQGKLFGVAPLLNHVVMSEVTRDGSSFRTQDVGHPITTTDRWFRPVDIKLGPEGGLYVADWYDGQTSHIRNQEGQIDKSNGRIYRLTAAGAKPIERFDLARLSSLDLIDRLAAPNRWTRQTALRLLGDRRDPSMIPILSKKIRESKGQDALEWLWAFNLSGGLDDAASFEFLDHADPFVRLWTIRLLGDPGQLSPYLAARLAERAKFEPDVEVRSQLACTSRRLPASEGLPIVKNLIGHDEDAGDIHLPFLLWWAIEAKAETDRDAVIALFREPDFWSRAIVKQTIAERVMRRYASTGTRRDLATCAELLKLAPSADDARRLMTGFEAALAGRTMPPLPESLVEALAKFETGSVTLGLRRGRPEAVDEALRVLKDSGADKGLQLRYVQILGEVDQPRALPSLVNLARHSADAAIQSAALASLQRFDDPAIADAVLESLPGMTESLRQEAFTLLASRAIWSLGLAKAVQAGKVEASSIPPSIIQRIRRHRDGPLTALVLKVWGEARTVSPMALQAEIERVAGLVRSRPGDPRKGEPIFARKCSICHTLFGKGGRVGPELTTYKRDDLDTMLLGLINPGAEIREGYSGYIVATQDGRSLSGLLVDQDPSLVVLRGAEGRDVSIPRGEIEEMEVTRTSIMPEGLLNGMPDDEIRDLLAYLRGNQPPK
jgi:putative heme-binding domain-containing protein